MIKPEYRWLLRRLRALNPFGEYLFEDNGERIITKKFRRRLRTVCSQAKVRHTSPNKIRKTYGSILLGSGIEESVITSQMGHTNIITTKGSYYVNRKNIAQREEALGKVSFL